MEAAAVIGTTASLSTVGSVAGLADPLPALDEAIASGGTGTREARQAAAAGHSWDVRSSALEAWLRDLVADGAPAKTMQHVLYPGI